jgi:hypothetical protein
MTSQHPLLLVSRRKWIVPIGDGIMVNFSRDSLDSCTVAALIEWVARTPTSTPIRIHPARLTMFMMLPRSFERVSPLGSVGQAISGPNDSKNITLVIGEAVQPIAGAQVVLSLFESNATFALSVDLDHLEPLAPPDPELL